MVPVDFAKLDFAKLDFAKPERIAVVDGHALVRDGLRRLLEQAFGCQVLEAADIADAMGGIERAGSVDLMLLDLPVAGRAGLAGLKAMRARFPQVPVAIVSALSDPDTVDGALAAGAAGFIPKTLWPDEVLAALHRVLSGTVYRPEPPDSQVQADDHASIQARVESLTPQQRVVLGRLADGLPNKQIAYELGVSMTTVKAHVSAILQKLQVASRTQASILANRIGFRG